MPWKSGNIESPQLPSISATLLTLKQLKKPPFTMIHAFSNLHDDLVKNVEGFRQNKKHPKPGAEPETLKLTNPVP